MDRRQLEFGYSLGHEWAKYILVAAILMVVGAVVLSLLKRTRPELKAASLGATVLAVLTVAFFFVTQLHIPCAAIMAVNSERVKVMKTIYGAEVKHASTHGGRFYIADDWQQKLGLTGLVVDRKAGSERFALNKALAGRTKSDVKDADEVVFIFVSTGAAVGSRDDLALLGDTSQALSLSGKKLFMSDLVKWQ